MHSFRPILLSFHLHQKLSRLARQKGSRPSCQTQCCCIMDIELENALPVLVHEAGGGRPQSFSLSTCPLPLSLKTFRKEPRSMDERNESRRWYWIYRPDLGRYVQMWHSFWRSLELVRREAEEAHGEQASAAPAATTSRANAKRKKNPDEDTNMDADD